MIDTRGIMEIDQGWNSLRLWFNPTRVWTDATVSFDWQGGVVVMIRFGILGVGFIGSIHARNIAANDGVQPEIRRQLCRTTKGGKKRYSGFDSTLLREWPLFFKNLEEIYISFSAIRHVLFYNKLGRNRENLPHKMGQIFPKILKNGKFRL